MTDVRYPSEDQQGRYVPDAEGAYSPYGPSGSFQGGYDQGYGQTSGYDTNVYSAGTNGGYPAVDSSGGWSAQAPSYDGYDATATYAGTNHDPAGYATPGYGSSAYGSSGYDASGYQPAYDASGYASVPGYDAYGRAIPGGSSDGYDSGAHAAVSGGYDAVTGYDASGTYGYAAVPDSGGYAAYGAQTQTRAWAVTDTAVQDAPAAPYVDPSWDNGSNTGMWYAASDTAAWESDTWFSPVPVRDDADMWSGGNRSTTDLFDDGTTPAPIEPAFDPGDHGDSVPARTDNEVEPDDDATDEPVERSRRQDRPAADTRPKESPAKAKVKRKRALPLTAGAPLAVMGAAAMAVAAIGGLHTAGAETKDADPVAGGEDLPLMSPMDKQLVDLQVGAEDFAERASRAQTRISLQERQDETRRAQEEAQRAQEAERQRKESLRPKYFLPVTQRGLSAYFGSSGSRWAHTHTGIDFPVDLGTSVFAVMDGVVRTEVNSAYGNMVILTAKDGTEFWYCHLTRAKIRSGPVKAGDVIAYSGDTGNSTGPHLHFEVRPGGGAPINPLPWLRANGLDPT
ncbi:peptidoglycan DD-metalloendopeptidase family protein [Embleya sp. NBC_00888]|uniref:peptidoglycan DD-metalloendopeptidase family protein n=1 Tax=Embleya sp. NBC_00888 TaxID=2975960 RepID=UPI003865745B|nr:peptidoglycan DD-metalloendopeptidase family protein [Embleya sp. NBC_00888]